MTSGKHSFRLKSGLIASSLCVAAIALTTSYVLAQQSTSLDEKGLGPSFEKIAKPFFEQNCVVCHNTDLNTAGIRVDQALDAKARGSAASGLGRDTEETPRGHHAPAGHAATDSRRTSGND